MTEPSEIKKATDAVIESLRCLALELPESVWNHHVDLVNHLFKVIADEMGAK